MGGDGGADNDAHCRAAVFGDLTEEAPSFRPGCSGRGCRAPPPPRPARGGRREEEAGLPGFSPSPASREEAASRLLQRSGSRNPAGTHRWARVWSPAQGLDGAGPAPPPLCSPRARAAPPARSSMASWVPLSRSGRPAWQRRAAPRHPLLAFSVLVARSDHFQPTRRREGGREGSTRASSCRRAFPGGGGEEEIESWDW